MDEFKKLVNKIYKRIVLEGLINSLIIGLLAGAILSIALSIVFYIVGFNYTWISALGFVVVALIVTLVLYFLKYKPDIKDVARRVDLAGLEERLITMVELKDSQSFMAQKQREDALKHLEEVKNTKLQLRIQKKLSYVSALISTLAVLGFILVQVSFSGGLPSFDDILPGDDSKTVNVGYFIDEGGFIEGEEYQIIPYGSETSEVVAVPEDGYMFEIWSDGVETPARSDKNVKENLEVFAIFIKFDDDVEPSDKEDEKLPPDDTGNNFDPNGVPPHGSGAAGKYEEYNQVIDGNTYYRDVYKEYYDAAMKILNESGKLPEYLRIIIEQYYGTIK